MKTIEQRGSCLAVLSVLTLGLVIPIGSASAQSFVDPSNAPVAGPDGTLYPPGTVLPERVELPISDLPGGAPLPEGIPQLPSSTGGWGQGPSILNGDLGSILNGGDLGSILNGDLGSILGGGDLGSILNGDLGSILGSDLDDILGLGDILGGDLGGLLGGGGLGDILGGDLGGLLGGGGLGDILGGDLGGLLGGDLGGLGDILGGGLGGIFGDGTNGIPTGALGDIFGGGGLGSIFGDGTNGIPTGALGDIFNLGGGNDAAIDIALPSLGESMQARNALAAASSQALVSNLTGAFGSAPGIVTGALGVPDVLASQSAVSAAVMGGAQGGSPGSASQRADRFSINPVSLSRTVGQELSRAASRGFSNTLLSEAGQQAIVDEVDAADETLTAIVDLATDAQDLDVTQDVMKNLSAQLAQQSSLDVAAYGQTIQLRQQFAADAVVQAEAAEELAAIGRRAASEPMAAAADVIQSTSTLLMF